jgi:hypothetical protein
MWTPLFGANAMQAASTDESQMPAFGAWAANALYECQRQGLAVPCDIAIAGSDDARQAQRNRPLRGRTPARRHRQPTDCVYDHQHGLPDHPARKCLNGETTQPRA